MVVSAGFPSMALPRDGNRVAGHLETAIRPCSLSRAKRNKSANATSIGSCIGSASADLAAVAARMTGNDTHGCKSVKGMLRLSLRREHGSVRSSVKARDHPQSGGCLCVPASLSPFLCHVPLAALARPALSFSMGLAA